MNRIMDLSDRLRSAIEHYAWNNPTLNNKISVDTNTFNYIHDHIIINIGYLTTAEGTRELFLPTPGSYIKIFEDPKGVNLETIMLAAGE